MGTAVVRRGADYAVGRPVVISVLFDAHFLGTPYSGNGRYTRSLLAAMQDRALVHPEFVITPYGPPLECGDKSLGAYVGVKGGRLARIWSAGGLAKDSSIDIHHSQYTMPITGHFKRCLTIHDAAFARRELSDYSLAKVLAFRHFACRADAVITGSHAAREDLERVLPSSCPPIQVVYDGCSLGPYSSAEEGLLQELLSGHGRPYILYIGRLSRRKRVPLLIQGFDEFRRSHGGTLVMVGDHDDDTPRISSLLKGRRDRDIVWLHTVPEGLKAALLKTCDAFVYLSEYEGFGLPIAEAMLARVPVVVAKTPALIEIGGGMAVQVDAHPVAVSEGIAAAVFDTATRTIDEAYQIATGYSWEATAAQTMEIYRALVGGTPH